jgi:oligopeptide transport system ATP-binding protein
LTVAQLVHEPMLIHGVPANETTIIGLLEEVGLNAGHLSRLPRELSGGQRQRVTIARALALEPELLICDEIVSALDVSVQAQVLNLLKDIQARRSLTLMFISHDIPVVGHMCDRIAVMQDGLIIEIGARDCIIQRPTTAYSREMIALLKR